MPQEYTSPDGELQAVVRSERDESDRIPSYRKGKFRRRKTSNANRAFIESLQALEHKPHTSPRVRALVGVSTAHHPSSSHLSSESLKPRRRAARALPLVSLPHNPFERPSDRLQPYGEGGIPDQLMPVLWSLALRHMILDGEASGVLRTINLGLSHKIRARAAAQPNTVSWLQKRIVVELRKALGRSLPFYIVLEESNKGILHVHGEVILNESDLPIAEDAFRRAGGVWRKMTQKQLKMVLEPDLGWAGYCAKHVAKATRVRRKWAKSKSTVAGFNGRASAAPNAVRTKAKATYETVCAEIIKQRAASSRTP